MRLLIGSQGGFRLRLAHAHKRGVAEKGGGSPQRGLGATPIPPREVVERGPKPASLSTPGGDPAPLSAPAERRVAGVTREGISEASQEGQKRPKRPVASAADYGGPGFSEIPSVARLRASLSRPLKTPSTPRYRPPRGLRGFWEARGLFSGS